jgi:hypothetical protein
MGSDFSCDFLERTEHWRTYACDVLMRLRVCEVFCEEEGCKGTSWASGGWVVKCGV